MSAKSGRLPSFPHFFSRATTFNWQLERLGVKGMGWHSERTDSFTSYARFSRANVRAERGLSLENAINLAF